MVPPHKVILWPLAVTGAANSTLPSADSVTVPLASVIPQPVIFTVFVADTIMLPHVAAAFVTLMHVPLRPTAPKPVVARVAFTVPVANPSKTPIPPAGRHREAVCVHLEEMTAAIGKQPDAAACGEGEAFRSQEAGAVEEAAASRDRHTAAAEVGGAYRETAGGALERQSRDGRRRCWRR